jgi:hypothetical protein
MIGKIEDIIIGRQSRQLVGIVSAGGFLGIGTHDIEPAPPLPRG